MEKILNKITIFMALIYLSINIFASDTLDQTNVLIDISEQRLYLLKDDKIIQSFPISSSKYGEGSQENSFRTPLGNHSIKEMIGNNAVPNTVFISRIDTKRLANIIKADLDTEDDYVTSRILWLEGAEEGFNKGPGIDSYDRYIYIHGTHEEGLIGQKASHGCIRMFNDDVITLYNQVKIGTKVHIKI